MGENSFKNVKFYTQSDLKDEDIRNRGSAIETGFPKLDQALDGGFTPGLIVLGAGPGDGKSTLALQIAEFIAERGTPVLYFSFEMSGERIASKMISRRMFQRAKQDKGNFKVFKKGSEAAERYVTSNDLFTRDSVDKVLEKNMEEFHEARNYVEGIENLYIIFEELSAIQIQKRVAQFVEEKKTLPFVIVDYLQIIPADAEGISTRSDKQLVEYNLQVMKQIQKQWKIPVLLISSLRRGNYSGEITPVQMDSFKETGGIEYSADLLMGIQYTAYEKVKKTQAGKQSPEEGGTGSKRRKKPVIYAEDEKGKYPREVSIHILKQRYGVGEELVPFHYYAPFDYFEDLSKPNEIPLGYYTGETEEKTRVETAISTKSYDKNMVFFNNTKIVNELRKGRAQLGKPVKCTVSRRNETGTYITYRLSCLNCPQCVWKEDPQGDGKKERDEQDLSLLPCKSCSRYGDHMPTCFDLDVADAVYSLYLTRHSQFTTGQVLRMLSGDGDQTETAKKREAIEESLNRLSGLYINIDCTAQLRKMGKIAYPEESYFSGALLSVEAKETQRKTRVYSFPKENPMPLQEYCEEIGHRIIVPKQLLVISEKPDETGAEGKNGKLHDTLENMKIKRYLVRRLEIIRNENNSFNSMDITLRRKPGGRDPGLLAEIGVVRKDRDSDTAWRNKCGSVYKTVDRILNCYKKIHYIRDYQLVDQDTIRISGPLKRPEKLF